MGAGTADRVRARLTQDGRKVEVIDGRVRLAGIREADRPALLIGHPDRQGIARWRRSSTGTAA